MKLLEPRRKRYVTAVPRSPFPIQIESETGIPASRALWQVYTGIFNGDCVVVDDPDEMDIIFNMGFFGKGSLSRGGPEFGKVKKGLPPYLRNRQWLRRKEWAEEQEKIQSATDSECVMKEEALVDGKAMERSAAAESGNSAKENVAPEKPDEITIVTAGPSGSSPVCTKTSRKDDGMEVDVITVDVSDDNHTKNNSTADLVSSAAKESLKEMDIVVLSDEEAPKRHAKFLNCVEEIEVIDDSSNDTFKKADTFGAHSSKEGDSKKDISETKSGNSSGTSASQRVCSESVVGSSEISVSSTEKDECDVNVPSSSREPQAMTSDTVPTDDVIEIMDVDVPAEVVCKDSNQGKGEEVECVVSGSSSVHKVGSSTDVITLQDNDSRSSADVVVVEHSNNRDADVAEQAAKKDDDSESEESAAEESCDRAVGSSLGSKVLVLPDSDSEDEGYKNFLNSLSARLEWEQFPVRETLHLSLEEAYFLSYGLGCLQVLDPYGNVLSLVNMWKMFREAQKDLVPKYVAYHYLRAKGWVVRSGLKYGGDFLLYKQGPLFYHASYVVIVEVLKADDWSRHPTLNFRSFSWKSMATLNRVVSAVGKDLLICQVLWPAGIPPSGPDSPAQLPQFAVNEVLMRRWVASEEREKDEENLDWDGQ